MQKTKKGEGEKVGEDVLVPLSSLKNKKKGEKKKKDCVKFRSLNQQREERNALPTAKAYIDKTAAQHLVLCYCLAVI